MNDPMTRWQARALGRLDGAVFLTSGSIIDLIAAGIALACRRASKFIYNTRGIARV
jgi:hypothetical protein